VKYYLWVLGCAMNHSDAERITTALSSLGYEKTDDESEANLIITVACSVRQHAVDRIYGALKKWERMKRKRSLLLGLSGCVLPEDKKKMSKVFDFIFNIDEIYKLPELLKGKTEKIDISDYLSINPEYESDFQAYVPIMTGCDNFCSYCAVPYTRGREKSRSKNEVISEVKGLIKNGYKEITLLGQNVNSYKDGFSELLKEIDKIKGDFRVYFYSNHPKDMSDELIRTISKLNHFPRYIHLPLQSGNDEIIKKMNRYYTKKKYLELVEKIRKTIPEVVLTTDIIVGFPGEGEKEFADTVEVMEKAKFEMAFISQYSPRSGTVSARMKDDISRVEKVRREKILTRILAKTANEKNQKLVGKKVRVLIDSQKNGKWYGRTDGYKVVEIPQKTKTNLLGQFREVEITLASAWKLFGRII
jgi:tRNA-2-methylthio-N6-dimethylallyladenosine synthase